jgi:hypothetical protein
MKGIPLRILLVYPEFPDTLAITFVIYHFHFRQVIELHVS